MRHTLNWLIRGLVSQRPSRRRGARNYTAPPVECLETRKNLSATALTSAAADWNDQISEAMYVGTASSPFTGNIDSPKDVDMFRFTATAGQRLSFDIDVTGRLDSVIRLFNVSGRELARNDDGAAPGELRSRESYLEYTFTSGGTYYLGISGYRNSNYNPITGTGDTNGSTGDYELTVQSISITPPVNPPVNPPVIPPVNGFDVEPNNRPSQANFLGNFGPGYTSSTYYGHTGLGSDTQDWFRIQLDGRTTGTIQITPLLQDLDIELYNSNGTLVGRSINSGTRVDTINLNGLPAGSYYLGVFPGYTGARGGYALRLGFRVS